MWDFAALHLIDPGGRQWHAELDEALLPSRRTWKDKPDVYHSLQATPHPAPAGVVEPRRGAALVASHLTSSGDGPAGQLVRAVQMGRGDRHRRVLVAALECGDQFAVLGDEARDAGGVAGNGRGRDALVAVA